MLNVGRLCVKIAGRDAGSKCVIVEITDNNFVVIDGNVKRKRCSISHLEPLKDSIDLEKGASHEDIIAAFKKQGIFSEKKKVRRKEKPVAEKKEKAKK
ncbi:50S ribosomal protein L14e [Candidatus Woesearchaeota archaeon]|nr:50S ribosomal protein L14e [Candidatus Woesearchaeota archaeon]|tara:strand:+ start:23303 stop:23596 length:294 start_codon:yes stop_codon:yes gene_type:complete